MPLHDWALLIAWASFVLSLAGLALTYKLRDA